VGAHQTTAEKLLLVSDMAENFDMLDRPYNGIKEELVRERSTVAPAHTEKLSWV
jgi:hypothetical protein